MLFPEGRLRGFARAAGRGEENGFAAALHVGAVQNQVITLHRVAFHAKQGKKQRIHRQL